VTTVSYSNMMPYHGHEATDSTGVLHSGMQRRAFAALAELVERCLRCSPAVHRRQFSSRTRCISLRCWHLLWRRWRSSSCEALKVVLDPSGRARLQYHMQASTTSSA
jgi:hypothetical protein